MAIRRIKIYGELAGYFSDDEIAADVVKSNYDSACNVLANLDKFPRANVKKLEWLSEALFNLSPIAAMEGR